MRRLETWINRYAIFLVTGILLVFFLLSLNLSRQDSLIMDEQAHIPAAYTYVSQGDMRLNPEHPPLIKDLAGLSLLLLQPKFPFSDPGWTTGVNRQWTLGQAFLFASGNNPEAITFWSRLPITLLAVLLGWFIFRWTRELAGPIVGLGALLLYVSDPNIIAHSHYVTTDIGIAALVFMSTYYFIRFLRRPTRRNILVAGIVLGLAELTKFSAVILWPLFAVITLAFAVAVTSAANDSPSAKRKTVWHKVWTILGKYIGLVLVSLVVLWVVYALNTWHTPAEKIRQLAVFSLADHGISRTATQVITTFSTMPWLKPLSEYLVGVFMVHDRVDNGGTFYFLGVVSNQGSRAYFPIIFGLKETLPLLLLLIFSILYAIRKLMTGMTSKMSNLVQRLRDSVHQHIAQYTMVVFVVIYVYLSISKNLNIGFRHLMPILPFLYVLIACAVASFVKRLWPQISGVVSGDSGHRLGIWSIVCGIVVVWIIAIPVLAYPNYLSYFNETVGGHRQGYRYATDSNYDWGQDLNRLQSWVRQFNDCTATTIPPACLRSKLHLTADALAKVSTSQRIDALSIDYFGGANPQYTFGDLFRPSHANDVPQPGWHAISLEFYQESTHKNQPPGEQSYDWLTTIPPVGRAGDSILIFFIQPVDLPAAEN